MERPECPELRCDQSLQSRRLTPMKLPPQGSFIDVFPRTRPGCGLIRISFLALSLPSSGKIYSDDVERDPPMRGCKRVFGVVVRLVEEEGASPARPDPDPQ